MSFFFLNLAWCLREATPGEKYDLVLLTFQAMWKGFLRFNKWKAIRDKEIPFFIAYESIKIIL